jgi:hypothetical protein
LEITPPPPPGAQFRSEHLEVSVAARSIHIKPVGRLQAADYELIRPALESFIAEHGTARILFDAEELEGWTPAAMWEDLKIGVHHISDIERIAIVVDRGWMEKLASLSGVFTKAQVRTFDRAALEEARVWIDGD